MSVKSGEFHTDYLLLGLLGLSAVTLVAWVHAFVNQVHTRTGRWPTIYTSTSWWKLCMGNNAGFSDDPLWIARYNSVLGALPPGWKTWAIWQYADSGKLPGDQGAQGCGDRKLADIDGPVQSRRG